MESLYIWLAAGVVFLIIEMMTVTLYGLSMSIAAFVVALYVYLTKAESADITQIIIFVVISTVCIFIFPKFFKLSKGTAKIGIDAYVGRTFKLKKVGNDWKVEIEGVAYLIDDNSVTPDFEEGKKIKVVSYEGTSLNVILV
ncbi:MAG: hypothetical protein PHZ26_05165 [Candidatus Gracilibacteria bacterium]|nr:hypothetical protein [Candidatus Gracilibacteria bacterium]MDD2909108.1 hypothetical protein [Candidatus Gracilibacteria bacterium]